MRLESLITCLDIEQSSDIQGFNLHGVFRKLAADFGRSVVVIELRGHSGALRVRCRVPGMTGDTGTWYESWDELALSNPEEDTHTIVFPLEDIEPPSGRSVVEALLDGRVAATRVVDFRS